MFSILAGALTTGNILIEANDGDNATINKMEALKTVAVRHFTFHFSLQSISHLAIDQVGCIKKGNARGHKERIHIQVCCLMQ